MTGFVYSMGRNISILENHTKILNKNCIALTAAVLMLDFAAGLSIKEIKKLRKKINDLTDRVEELENKE